MKAASVFNRFYVFLAAAIAYITLSVSFLFGVISSKGNVAQQDWVVPLTASAAVNDFHSAQFVWQYNGFGGLLLVVGASRTLNF